MEKLEIEQLQHQHEELQEKMDASQLELESVRAKLRQTVESIDVADEFYAIAQSCSVIIETISSSTIQSEKLNGIACSKTSLNAVAKGRSSDLISFIIKLNSDFTTGAVKVAQISIKESDGEDKSSASIQVDVYTYEGD